MCARVAFVVCARNTLIHHARTVSGRCRQSHLHNVDHMSSRRNRCHDVSRVVHSEHDVTCDVRACVCVCVCAAAVWTVTDCTCGV
jgi:hypothetical protein